jgi:hypothetical protein
MALMLVSAELGRDEEKARAKERIFSVRDEFGQWDPKRQRPELWNIYNGKDPQRRKCEGISNQQLDRAGCLELYQKRTDCFAKYLFCTLPRLHNQKWTT